mgnify:FL=1
MRIVVTGAGGWLGGIVYNHFNKDHHVMGIDLKKNNKSLIFLKDLSQGNFPIQGRYDAVFHFAAAANVNEVIKDPVGAVKSNVLATANVLSMVRESKIPKFFYISSGWCQLWPQNKHPYTATKLAGEMLCRSFGETYQTPYKILRLGTLYGPGARSGTAIANFTAKALKGEPITIFGDGKATRRYLFTTDLCTACEQALSVDCRPDIRDTYDICGAQEVSVLDVAEMVKKVVKDVPIQFAESRPGDLESEITPYYQTACIELDWEPQIGLEEGIKRYADWLSNQSTRRGDG